MLTNAPFSICRPGGLHMPPSSRQSALIFVFLRLRLEPVIFPPISLRFYFRTETNPRPKNADPFIQRIETTNEIRGRSCYLHSIRGRLFIFFSKRERECVSDRIGIIRVAFEMQARETQNYTRVISAQNVACNLFRRRVDSKRILKL